MPVTPTSSGKPSTGRKAWAESVSVSDTEGMGPPETPDGRYFVVRGRLWRCSDPRLDPAERQRLTAVLMNARRAKKAAMKAGDEAAREQARAAVEAAKVALGERGPVWWTDGSPDLNRHLAKNTPYREWAAAASLER